MGMAWCSTACEGAGEVKRGCEVARRHSNASTMQSITVKFEDTEFQYEKNTEFET
jgi:hypothetical protein